jgi:hypothetical protein
VTLARWRLVVVTVVFAWRPTASDRQVLVTHLAKPSGKLSVPLNAPTSVRELADGRVLVSELGEKRIVVADLRLGTVTPIGRLGAGPQEYRAAVPVADIGHDSTVMADPFGRRWLLLSGARIVATLPATDPAVRAATSPATFDDQGHFLLTRLRGPADSQQLVLVARRDGKETPIGKLQPPVASLPGNRIPPYAPDYDVAVLSKDGWVAVRHAQPYSVDWRSPGGTWIRGPVIAVIRPHLSSADKVVYQSRRAKLGSRPIPDSLFAWPETLPPVAVDQSPQPTPDGKLLVQLNVSARQPNPRYDVIDRRGNREKQLELAANQEILGFGKTSVYVITIDADGLAALSRHPWP